MIELGKNTVFLVFYRVQGMYTKCASNVEEMYKKCTEMYEKMYKKCTIFCTVLDTNVQRMYRNYVQKRSKPTDRFRGGYFGRVAAESVKYIAIAMYLTRFELTVLNGLREFRTLFWGHVLEVFANGICVSAVQNTTPELLWIGPILSDVCLSDV